MRDYYAEYLSKKSELFTENQVSKVSKGNDAMANGAFDTFDTASCVNNSHFFWLDKLLKTTEMREQFEFEVKELTSIMISDSDLSHSDAERLAYEDVRKRWEALFGD